MLGNVVMEGCNAPGTGALTTSGPPQGRVGFVQYFGTGAKCYYGITDGSQTEEGWTVTGPQLTRNVLWNSVNGSSTLLNFTGACQVYNPLPAQRAMWADETGTYWNAQNRSIAIAGPAQAPDQVPRLDQVAWQQVGQRINVGSTPGYAAGVVNITFGVPASARRIKIEWDEVLPVVAGNGMICRVSTDGPTYLSGAQDYLQQSSLINGTTPNISLGDYSYIGVLPSMATVATAAGSIDMYVNDDHSFFAQGRAFVQNAGWWSQISNGRCTGAAGARLAAVLIGIPGGFARGNVRMTMAM